MKKIIVSSIVIVTFVMYSTYQRAAGVQSQSIINPQSTHISAPTVAPTLTSTPTPLPSHSPQSTPTDTPLPTPTPKPVSRSGYKDGAYTGDAADAFYGYIQVQATIQNGNITSIKFLQAPSDRGTSIEINSQADPVLAQEAIQAQSANVDVVSGATDSSNAFMQSLQSALNKAKA